ncbi:hypothetical protein GCM10011316_11710 [Roseibium aquae]|uniref:Uncharacterized protein n=1 Tax=Roseibium aquae TaxID=1323746 RepID=A0A916WXF7_9HYPH|nr:hypothetical protein GCM10011316_11710 [Roseibium aquae]
MPEFLSFNSVTGERNHIQIACPDEGNSPFPGQLEEDKPTSDRRKHLTHEFGVRPGYTARARIP